MTKAEGRTRKSTFSTTVLAILKPGTMTDARVACQSSYGKDLTLSSAGLCSRCNDIMKNVGNRGNKGVPARSWRTLQLYSDLNATDEAFPIINLTDWPARDVWIVSSKMPGTCSLCLFFPDCATEMGVTPQAILSNEKSLFARLVPYKFMTGLPTSLLSSSAETWTSVTDTRVLEPMKQNGEWKTRVRSADYGRPLWPATSLVLPAQACSGDGHMLDTVNYGIISEWLAYCQSTHHKSCTAARSLPLTTTIPGLQLIDCYNGRIIPAEGMSTSAYVTLSYVWGGGPVDLDMVESSRGLPVLPNSSRLPKVISDAMEVVRRLGYRYLWVDRYCIPQGNSQVKHLQIQSMGKIYSLSKFTIIAAAGENADHGLPGVSPSPLSVPQIKTTITHGNLRQDFVYFKPPTSVNEHSVWASRGWTFQEALLSRRRLVFTDRNVFFQCQLFETVGLETYP